MSRHVPAACSANLVDFVINTLTLSTTQYLRLLQIRLHILEVAKTAVSCQSSPTTLRPSVWRLFLICDRTDKCPGTYFRVQLNCDGTWWRTGGEVKGKLANGVYSQYSSHYLGTWCTQHYYSWCAHLGCRQSTELTPPTDLNGLVRFAERRNLVSARVPSHFKRSLPPLDHFLRIRSPLVYIFFRIPIRPSTHLVSLGGMFDTFFNSCVWAGNESASTLLADQFL
jgi:hypothetical protein